MSGVPSPVTSAMPVSARPSWSEVAPAGSVSFRTSAPSAPLKIRMLPASPKLAATSSSGAPAAMSGVPSPVTSPIRARLSPSWSLAAPAGSVSLRICAPVAPLKRTTLPASPKLPTSSRSAPTARSGVPSPEMSPIAMTRRPRRSLLALPLSVSRRTNEQLAPEKTSTLPLSKKGLTSSNHEPTATSGVPSPVTSPIPATS